MKSRDSGIGIRDSVQPCPAVRGALASQGRFFQTRITNHESLLP
jgi:hypothetical protein